jgi:hypothetical protein
LLKYRLKSPLSPLNSVINYVLKACQITIQSAAILEKEISDLRATNETKKRKKTRSIRQMPLEEGLSALGLYLNSVVRVSSFSTNTLQGKASSGTFLAAYEGKNEV